VSRYQLHISLRNSPEALAKLVLLLKQGQLSLVQANIVSDTGDSLAATFILEGRHDKISWLAKKTANFPFFHECRFEEVKD